MNVTFVLVVATVKDGTARSSVVECRGHHQISAVGARLHQTMPGHALIHTIKVVRNPNASSSRYLFDAWELIWNLPG